MLRNIKRLYTTNNIFSNLKIKECEFNHNMKFVEEIQFTIHNPNKLNIFNTTIYKATIILRKNDMTLYKNFNSDQYDDLIQMIKNYINDTIKL